MEEQAMYEGIIDAVTRRLAGVVSRRSSLRALGAAALAATVTRPSLAKAGKARKNSRKRCNRQAPQCRAFYRDFCQGNPTCEEDFFACCTFLGRCNASGWLQCFYAIT
jgi:hypothetical protein